MRDLKIVPYPMEEFIHLAFGNFFDGLAIHPPGETVQVDAVVTKCVVTYSFSAFQQQKPFNSSFHGSHFCLLFMEA
jgi:hypothetical protein